MNYGPGEGPLPVKNRHAWTGFTREQRASFGTDGIHCCDCFIVKVGAKWRDPAGEWHTGPIPRCGESTWGRP